VNGWTFFYLMVVLKIPIVALLWIVWWAIRQTPDPEPGGTGGDGGSPVRAAGRHPRGPLPRAPRRGPHGGGSAPAPPRTRPLTARALRPPHRHVP
jgi:hypothetical protein